ncbi:MAG: DUF3794 domain-containing protein [Clostridia bacterium]|nr:DUF3794 domain-containing protein [Clostridia bacterium]
MDVTMGKKTVACYHKIFEYRDVSESAMELVVPDTMPDIDRLLCADGTLVIRSKEVSEGSVSVSAGISASVLYVPDGAAGPCCLKAAVPFAFEVDAPGVTSDSVPVATLTLTDIEARMLNPRKVIIRASVAVTIECFDRSEAEYSSEVSGGEKAELQVLTERSNISHVVGVKEKTFVITDEYRLPAGSPPVGEPLRENVELCAEDVRTVGSKVVINGSAKIVLTYSVDGSSEIASAVFETAFSQLVDMDIELTAPECRTALLLTAVYIEPHNYAGGERGYTCELHIVAQAVCSDNIGVEYISDCYSNRLSIRTTAEPVRVICDIRRSLQRCGFHETLEADRTVGEVIEASCRATDFETENGNIECKITAYVIFSDDSGKLFCAGGRFPFACPAGFEEGMTGAVTGAHCAQVYATPAQKSIDLRTQVCFDLMMWRESEICQIAEIDDDEEGAAMTDRPSLVVVRAGEDATLWTLAKRYRSTREIILQANGLEEGEPITGRLLLIPSVK